MNELRVRLLKTDKNSPSGYKPVGYFKHTDGGVYQRYMDENKDWIDLNNSLNETYLIDHDSCELGFRHDGQWWFSGDKILFDNEDVGILAFEDKRGFYINFAHGYCTLDTTYTLKLIGNIHGGKDNDK